MWYLLVHSRYAAVCAIIHICYIENRGSAFQTQIYSPVNTSGAACSMRYIRKLDIIITIQMKTFWRIESNPEVIELRCCREISLEQLMSPLCGIDLEDSAAISLYLVSTLILFITCLCLFITCWCLQHICVTTEFRLWYCNRHCSKYVKVYKVHSLNHFTKRIPRNGVLSPPNS